MSPHSGAVHVPDSLQTSVNMVKFIYSGPTVLRPSLGPWKWGHVFQVLLISTAYKTHF